MHDSKKLLRLSAFLPAAIACLLHASNARGSGDPASIVEIAPRAQGSDVVGVSYVNSGNGLLYSKDGGKTFATMCKMMASQEVVDEDGKVTIRHPSSFSDSIVTHDGHILIGEPGGLWTDDGHGCNWRLVPELRNAFVKNLVFDPTDPTIIYGVTGAGADGVDNGLFRRNADGSIERVGPQEPLLFFSVQAVALPSGGVRIYTLARTRQVTVLVEGSEITIVDPPDGGALTPGLTYASELEIRHSDDRGETWTSHGLDLSLASVTRIAAVDPTNPDRVVLHLRHDKDQQTAAAPDIVRVSEDRGATFRDWVELSEVGGISITADGTVWLGEHGEGSNEDSRGLWRADSLLDAPEKLADYDVWCVEAREDRLEVCQRFEWGTADPATGAFTKVVSFDELDTIHSCDDVDGVAACQSTFCMGLCVHWCDAPFCTEHCPLALEACAIPPPVAGSGGAGGGGGGGGDAAVPVADAGASATSKSSGCDCHALSNAGRSAHPSMLIGVALAWLLRVRRTRRSKRATR